MVIPCWWQTLKLGVSCMVSKLVSMEITTLITTVSNFQNGIKK